MGELRPNHFEGAHVNDILIVKDLPTFNNLLYNGDVLDGDIIKKLA